jgi:hypothetical protein
VTRPASTDQDLPVILTGEVKSNIPSTVPVISNFDITILKQLADDQTALKVAAAALTIGYAPGDGPSSVTSDLILPIRSANNAVIAWSSNSPTISKGADFPNYSIWNVTRSASTGNNATVTLTATISVNSKVSVTREFNISVLKQLSGDEAVKADAAALTIGYAPGDGPSGVTRNLILANKGTNGSIITWSSGNTAVIDNSGVAKRPASAEDSACIVMKAAITNADGSVAITKLFYSPDLLGRDSLDRNLLANILLDPEIDRQLRDTAVGV